MKSRRLTDEQRGLLDNNWAHVLWIARDIARPGTPEEEIYDATVDAAMAAALNYRNDGWSYGTFFAFCVRRVLFKYYRARMSEKRHSDLTSETPDKRETPGIEIADMAEKALSTLTDRQRDVMKMAFIDGMSESEIAAQLGCTRQNIGRIKHTAFRDLRRRLKS